MHLHLPPLLQGLISIAVLLGIISVALKLFDDADSKQNH